MLDFVSGGMMGDLIQSLYAVKELCIIKKCKSNVYIAEGYGDVFKYSLDKTHSDLKDLLYNQDYINYFGIFDPQNPPVNFIDLTHWRTQLVKRDGVYVDCWTDILSRCYNFIPSGKYSWLKAPSPNSLTVDKIVIHRSVHRYNAQFPWKEIIEKNQDKEIIFLMANDAEWDKFPYKRDNIKPLHMSTITDIANAISPCKLLICNQSAPASLACGLDVPRLVELDADPAAFYMGETKYSNNISWFLNDNKKYYTNNLLQLIK